MVPFRGLSVCLFVTFVHCAQTAEDIDTISFAYYSRMSLSDRVKIRMLTPLTPTTSPFPKWGSQMHFAGLTSRRVLSPGEYAICCILPNYIGHCSCYYFTKPAG